MAMANGKSIKNAIKAFVKDYGREPTLEEFQKLISGQKIEVKKDA